MVKIIKEKRINSKIGKNIKKLTDNIKDLYKKL